MISYIDFKCIFVVNIYCVCVKQRVAIACVLFVVFFLSSGMTDFDNHLICWIEAVFFRSIHVRFDERIDISIPILRLMTIKFGKPLHIGQVTQVGLIKQVPVMSSLQDYARLVTYNEELLSRKPQDPLSRGRARSLYRLITLYFHYHND